MKASKRMICALLVLLLTGSILLSCGSASGEMSDLPSPGEENGP